MKLYFLGLRRNKPPQPKLELFIAADNEEQAIEIWFQTQANHSKTRRKLLSLAVTNQQELWVFEVPAVPSEAGPLHWRTDVPHVVQMNMTSLTMQALFAENELKWPF